MYCGSELIVESLLFKNKYEILTYQKICYGKEKVYCVLC